MNIPDGRVYIISAPFSYLTMPSLEIASLKAQLSEREIVVSVDLIDAAYAQCIGCSVYATLHQSILGDAVFAALLFPDNLKVLAEEIEPQRAACNFDFEGTIEETQQFVLAHLSKNQDSLKESKIVLFHMFTRQLFPALYLAKVIHDRFGSRIWLSGFHCQGECGESLLAMFPFIDRVFGENTQREITAAVLGVDSGGYEGSLDDFPTPDYSDFWTMRKSASQSFREEFIGHYWLQSEMSRGCWWGACTFCTLNCQHKRYEEKSIDSIIRDYETLQKRYGTVQILNSVYHSGHHWKETTAALLNRFPGMKGNLSAYLKVANLQSTEDMLFIQNNDINLLVGIESFSSRGLALMNKGQSVMQVVYTLKLAERYNVKCHYNLICSMPFEDESYFQETESVVDAILHFRPPFDLEIFRLTYGSSIFKNPERYGILSMGIRKDREGILLPRSLQSRYVPFFMDYESENPGLSERVPRWKALIDYWCDVYYGYAKEQQPKKESLLCKRWNDDVLELRDSRYNGRTLIHVLRGDERKAYDLCDEPKNFREIERGLGPLEASEIESLLDGFVEKKLMFKEGASYLSLAI